MLILPIAFTKKFWNIRKSILFFVCNLCYMLRVCFHTNMKPDTSSIFNQTEPPRQVDARLGLAMGVLA